MGRWLPFLLVGAGSFVGGNLRYLLGRWAGGFFAGRFPAGTLLVNLTGSFLLGLIAGALAQRDSGMHDEGLYLALGVGFCGGFTTFSAFELETHALLAGGAWGRAIVYALLSVLVGLLALRWGLVAGRGLVARLG